MKKKPKYLTAGNAATTLGISIDTVRRWDKRGLIKSFRDERNARIFSLDEISRIKNKNRGNKKNGFKVLKNKKKSPYTTIELFAGAGGTLRSVWKMLVLNMFY